MAIEVFNRYENKYMLDESTFEKLQNKLSEYMKLDAYNENRETYTVTNLYYDTLDNHLIRTSIQKPKYKEKLRLRAYRVPEPESKVYLEIKKKVAGLVNKRRSTLKLEEAYKFISSGVLPPDRPYHNRQVLKEISYLLETHTLYPARYLAYDRRAYFGIEQTDLRVSFDSNIRTRDYDLSLEAGDFGTRLLDGDYRLMEIKVAQSIPIWLCRLLSEYKIYPVSFSKYGAEYQKTLKASQNAPIFNSLIAHRELSQVAVANA